jgi:transcription elongation GreA/GreB family factor
MSPRAEAREDRNLAAPTGFTVEGLRDAKRVYEKTTRERARDAMQELHNADYQYGKRRLRQIDGRIRFLTERIEAAEVVDPETPRAGQAATRAFFGATVRYANAAGAERVVSIVGTDEVDLNRNHISWVSPLGRALMKSAAGDSVVLQAPRGTEYVTVLDVCYERISVEPFREPPGSEASAKGLTRRLWLSKNLSDTKVRQLFEGDVRDSLKIINCHKGSGRADTEAAARHGYTAPRVRNRAALHLP